MKRVQSYIGEFWWPLVVAAGILAPGIVFAEAPKGSCEAKAQAVFQKKAVEMEMALIAGSLNDLEHSSAREGLQDSLRQASAKCAKASRTGKLTARAVALDTTTGAL